MKSQNQKVTLQTHLDNKPAGGYTNDTQCHIQHSCKTNKYSVLARRAYVSSLALKEEGKFIWTSNENETTPESTVYI